MESADLGHDNHSAVTRWRHQAWFGRVLLEREMRTRRRVVADVRFQDLSETGSAQHDDMVETLAANGADEPVVFHDWIDGQGRPIVYAKGAFGLSAQPIEFLQRHIELSKNFEEQRRADFPSTMQWDSNGPSIAVRPAFVAASLAAPHETKR